MTSEEQKFKVDFIGIGAPKCGTTWVAECLAAHPEVSLAKHKEPNFFLSSEFRKAMPESRLRFFHCRDFEGYRQEFAGPGKIKGEISPFYLYDRTAPEAIRKFFPEVKIIVCLRNPADFAYSAYWFTKSSSQADELPASFEEAIAKAGYLKERGFFYKYLKGYYDVFPARHFHIIIHDDIKERPREVARDLFRFLAIDDTFKPACLGRVVNKTQKLRSLRLAKVSREVGRALLRLKLDSLYARLYYTYSRLNKKPFRYPPLAAATRKQLQDIYSQDVNNLAKLIQRDLSTWQ